MSDIKFGKFKYDLNGVREILKSAPVRDEIEKHADRIAGNCVSACYADRGSKGHFISDEQEPYRAWMDEGEYTARGHVSTVNLEGYYFDKKTKMLDSHNH